MTVAYRLLILIVEGANLFEGGITMKKNRIYCVMIAGAFILGMSLGITGCSKRESTETVYPEETSSGKYSDRYYYPTTDEYGHGETGTPPGVIMFAQVMVNGKIYECTNATAWASLPTGDFKEAGTILEVDVCVEPKEDLCATGISVPIRSGQKVYTSEKISTQVIVQCDDGNFYIFQERK